MEVCQCDACVSYGYFVMPQVLFRAIKAKIPKWEPFYNEVSSTLDSVVKPDLIAWFNKIVARWKHRPSFKATCKITQSEMTVNVYPAGTSAKIWRYVSLGTKGPYPIPKAGNTNAKILKFKGGYKARTNTSGGYNGPGKAAGKTVFSKHVTHPGIKARNFEKHIARWYYPKFRKVMKNAVARGLRKARA